MAIRGLRQLVAGNISAGLTDRDNILKVNEQYLLEAVNLREIDNGTWEVRGGFEALAQHASPDGTPYLAMYDYQMADGTRKFIGVTRTNIWVDGSVGFTLSSPRDVRGKFTYWSINNILYYYNGRDTLRYDGTSWTSIELVDPTTAQMASVAGTATGTGFLTAGDYRIRLTWVTSSRESNQGAVSPTPVTSSGSDTVAWTGLPLGPSGTISRNVYRTVANGSVYFFEQNIPNNTATTVTSSVADSSLGDRAPTGRDNPSGFNGIEIFNDHAFGWLDDTLYFSKLGSPEEWEIDADFIDFPGDTGDVTGGIVAAVNYRGRIYVIRNDSIHFIQGNNIDDFRSSRNSINFGPIGAIARDSITIMDGLMYFISEQGPYVFDGASIPKYIGGNNPRIWDPYHIHRILNHQQVSLIQALYYKPKHQWIVAIPEAGQNRLSTLFVYHLRYRSQAPDTGIQVGAWSKYESSLFPFKSMAIVEGTSGIRLDVDRLLLADMSGNVYQHDTTRTDNGTNPSWRWLSSSIDFNNPHVEKRWMSFTPFFSENLWGRTIEVQFFFDSVPVGKQVFEIDLGSDSDASSIWGQMLWGDDLGYWTGDSKTVSVPITINKTSQTLHVLMTGSQYIKFFGYAIAAVPQPLRLTPRGTVRAHVRN